MRYKVFITFSNGHEEGVYVTADNDTQIDIIGASDPKVTKFLDTHSDLSIINISHTVVKAKYEIENRSNNTMRIIDNDTNVIVEFRRGCYNETAKVVSAPKSMGKTDIQRALNGISGYIARYHQSDAAERDFESEGDYISRIVLDAMRAKNITAEQLAEKSGVPLIIIRNIIKVGKCKASQLVMVAEALGGTLKIQF